MSDEPSHLEGVLKQHEEQIKSPDLPHAQKQASLDAISRLKNGDISERELGSNTPTPEEQANRGHSDPVAENAAEVAQAASKALPQDGPQ